MGLHGCLKSSLKILAFSKKIVTNLLSANKGGTIVTFLPLTNDLSIVQYVFAEVERWLNLVERSELYFFYEYLKISTRVLLIDSRLVAFQFPIANILLYVSFLLLIFFLISSLKYGGSLPLQVIVLLGTKFWKMFWKKLSYWRGRPDHEHFYSHKIDLSQKSLIAQLIIFTLVFL